MSINVAFSLQVSINFLHDLVLVHNLIASR